ncbi:MAG: RNA polymerase subunit sigma-24 [Betaproteobacteria bacterium HGW-Betaproteobacteria-22]|nr:MAG: RNA polymerase subunit sigma-24 [Betaproteobacteria bacterium HGW-Betaproteobacteria-22]
MGESITTDEDLMRKFCAGDMRAFELLYQRHERPIYRYIRRLMGGAFNAQADDVFQDVWIRLIDARLQWQPRENASFKTWLYTLAHHRTIDILRKSGREVSVDEGWLDDEPGSPWQSWPAAHALEPEQQVFWRKAGQRLLHCLDGLPAMQRAAFLLHHEDGLSVDEMRLVLNAEFEAIKSRLRYALFKLRACMGAYLPPMVD